MESVRLRSRDHFRLGGRHPAPGRRRGTQRRWQTVRLLVHTGNRGEAPVGRRGVRYGRCLGDERADAQPRWIRPGRLRIAERQAAEHQAVQRQRRHGGQHDRAHRRPQPASQRVPHGGAFGRRAGSIDNAGKKTEATARSPGPDPEITRHR